MFKVPLFTAVAMSIVLLIASALPAEACACVVPVPPLNLTPGMKAKWERDVARREVKEDFMRAVAIFSGEVIADDIVTVRFNLDRVWKGELPKEFPMSTGIQLTQNGMSSNDCDYSFQSGKKYLVFAYGSSVSTMRAYVCSRTRKLSDATLTIDALDAFVKQRARASKKR
jgi:hypothetical protein